MKIIIQLLEKGIRWSIYLFLALFLVLFLIGTCIPCVNRPREKSRRVNCYSNLKQIGLALKQYSLYNADMFPDKSGAAGLELLRKNDYLADSKLYTCPSSKSVRAAEPGAPLTEENVSFIYFGGFSECDDSYLPLAIDKPDNHKNYRNVLFIDGHVSNIPGGSSDYSSIVRAVKEKEVKTIADKHLMCADNLKMIGVALKRYSADNAGRYPDKNGVACFDLLRKKGYLGDSSIYTCNDYRFPVAEPNKPLSEENVAYLYIGGASRQDGPDVPIAMDKLGNHNNFVNLLFADGHVEGIHGKFNSYSEIMKMLREKAAKRNKK